MICEDSNGRPMTANLFINEENIDFGLADEEPIQSLSLNNWTYDS